MNSFSLNTFHLLLHSRSARCHSTAVFTCSSPPLHGSAIFFLQMLQFQFGFSVHHFCFMYAIIIGTRPDGSRVLLNRPHGTALRVGTPVFRAILLSCGASRRIRTIIYTFVEPSEWYQLQIAHSRIFLFFDFQPPTVVLSPRVERVPLPASPEAQSSVSEDGSDVS